jgi:hypothetical protein
VWPCDVTTENTPFKECRVVFSALDSSVAGPIEEAFAQFGIAGTLERREEEREREGRYYRERAKKLILLLSVQQFKESPI